MKAWRWWGAVPWGVIALLVVHAGVLRAQQAVGAFDSLSVLTRMGCGIAGDFSPLRLVASRALHADLGQSVGNAVLLAGYGVFLERAVGGARLVLLWILAGVLGAAADATIVSSLGAEPSTYALHGAVLGLLLRPGKTGVGADLLLLGLMSGWTFVWLSYLTPAAFVGFLIGLGCALGGVLGVGLSAPQWTRPTSMVLGCGFAFALVLVAAVVAGLSEDLGGKVYAISTSIVALVVGVRAVDVARPDPGTTNSPVVVGAALIALTAHAVAVPIVSLEGRPADVALPPDLHPVSIAGCTVTVPVVHGSPAPTVTADGLRYGSALDPVLVELEEVAIDPDHPLRTIAEAMERRPGAHVTTSLPSTPIPAVHLRFTNDRMQVTEIGVRATETTACRLKVSGPLEGPWAEAAATAFGSSRFSGPAGETTAVDQAAAYAVLGRLDVAAAVLESASPSDDEIAEVQKLMDDVRKESAPAWSWSWSWSWP